MEDNDTLRKALDYYRQQYARKLAEAASIQTMIRQMEADLGESSGESDSPQIPFPDALGGASGINLGSQILSVRPDEFFGMTQSDAAKAYLRKAGKAVSLDQLVDALRRGGATLGGANPKKTLYVSLARNPMREFVMPSEGFVGLREFYPNLPKGGKPPKSKPKSRYGASRSLANTVLRKKDEEK